MLESGAAQELPSSLVEPTLSLIEAASDPARLDQFLHAAAASVGASAAIAIPLAEPSRSPFFCSHGLPQGFPERWRAAFPQGDPWRRATVLPPKGSFRVIVGEEVAPDAHSRLSEAAQALITECQLDHLRALWLRPSIHGASPWGIYFWRPRRQGGFSASAARWLHGIGKLVSRVDEWLLASAIARAEGFGTQRSAIFYLGQRGRVIACNSSGEELIRKQIANDGPLMLSFNRERVSAWLHDLIERGQRDNSVFADGARMRDSLQGVGEVLLEMWRCEPLGQLPSLHGAQFVLAIRLLGTKSESALGQAAARLYRWTAAEVDTVSRLATGDALPKIALARGCSLETVRSHLKNAKRKAGVKRQIELVRLVLAMQGGGPA